MMRLACLLALPALTRAHGAMTQPTSRNALDGNVAPWYVARRRLLHRFPQSFFCIAPRHVGARSLSFVDDDNGFTHRRPSLGLIPSLRGH